MNQQTDLATQQIYHISFVIVPIILLVIGLISYCKKHKRLDGLSELAKTKGWRYNKSADVSLTTKVPGFPFMYAGERMIPNMNSFI